MTAAADSWSALVTDTLAFADPLQSALSQACGVDDRGLYRWGPAAHFLRRGRNLLTGIAALSELHLGLDAKEVLARALFEAAVNAAYLYSRDDIDVEARRFFDYDVWIAYRTECGDVKFLRSQGLAVSPEKSANVAALEQKTVAFCKKYCAPRHSHTSWSGLDIFGMARAAGMSHEYQFVYRPLCQVVHSALRSFRSARHTCVHQDSDVLFVGEWALLNVIGTTLSLMPPAPRAAHAALYQRFAALQADTGLLRHGFASS